jgi:hypothetical protein
MTDATLFNLKNKHLLIGTNPRQFARIWRIRCTELDRKGGKLWFLVLYGFWFYGFWVFKPKNHNPPNGIPSLGEVLPRRWKTSWGKK